MANSNLLLNLRMSVQSYNSVYRNVSMIELHIWIVMIHPSFFIYLSKKNFKSAQSIFLSFTFIKSHGVSVLKKTCLQHPMTIFNFELNRWISQLVDLKIVINFQNFLTLYIEIQQNLSILDFFEEFWSEIHIFFMKS